MRLATALLAVTALGATAVPSMAHEVVYRAALNGASEFPTNDSAGTGSARVTFDVDLYKMRVEVSFSGLTGNTTNSHIHCCTATSGLGGDAAASLAGNVGVATRTPTFLDFPAGVTFGSYDKTYDMLDLGSYNPAFVTANAGGAIDDLHKAQNAFDALVNGAAAGKAYLNIHSSYKSGGEIRGFLAPVPEPETYALMLAGLGLVGWAAKRRARVC
ncbi:MAG: FxDxF family PEP-CTERM protein [Burkholderiaceae bacterium]|nr:FxDxF family PEP-CTERM protein [Burkholderiaceae bacterium]